MKLSVSLFLLALSASHGLPVCEQFITISSETSIDGILDDFKVEAVDLELLNPGTDLTNLVDGTPVCVVGTAEGKTIGSRPGNLVRYKTSPGTDTCMNTIIKYAQPPVSMQTFEELNTSLNCQTLDFQVGTVFLPSGTTVGSNISSSSEKQNLRPFTKAVNNQNCIIGSWGDWTPCSPTGTQSKFRNVFVQASGNGSACPETFETRSCDGEEHKQRHLLAPNECPAGYDGCSLPSGLETYHLFTPACNVHDICYSCNHHSGWEFASKDWCDGDFFNKMIAQCRGYWTGWWQGFDLAHCENVAGLYLAAVAVAGNPDNYENPTNGNLLSDGCYWFPWEGQVNNANGAGFLPSSAGCPCDGTSCDYW